LLLPNLTHLGIGHNPAKKIFHYLFQRRDWVSLGLEGLPFVPG